MLRSAILCLIVLHPLAAAAEGQSAVETVRGFYTPTIWNPLELDSFSGVTEPALSIFRKNAEITKASGEMGCIDFVVTVDAQDYDEAEIAKTLVVEETGQGGGTATDVVARYKLFEEPREILWSMQEEDGVWKVADITSKTGGWQLSKFACE